jgi:capsular polysaccharide transport system ATP-binding protein
MIRLLGINKRYHTQSGMMDVLSDINLTIAPGERVGILGRNGAGKSTLIRLISGAEQPSTGKIERGMSVSWPLAFGGAFQSALTGLDNLRFICRIYGRDPQESINFVQEFSELGIYLREPVRTYSAGMRARLAFAISMVVEFDCFLIDEIIAVGDARFHDKCHNELFINRADRAMIIVSHDANYIKEHCHKAAVLNLGKLHNFENIDEAYAYYTEVTAL